MSYDKNGDLVEERNTCEHGEPDDACSRCELDRAEYAHIFGCICADCSDAPLTADND